MDSQPVAASPHEESLVDAARGGDHAARTALYRRFHGLVHGVLLSCVPRSEVEDLAQDVFMRAFAKLSSLRDAGAFGPWIATLARNRARDFHRASKPSVPLPESLPADDAKHDEALAVLALVRSHPEAYRETLDLRFVEGMTGPEIAAATGLTPGSVRVNLHRGTQMLREKLAEKRSHG